MQQHQTFPAAEPLVRFRMSEGEGWSGGYVCFRAGYARFETNDVTGETLVVDLSPALERLAAADRLITAQARELAALRKEVIRRDLQSYNEHCQRAELQRRLRAGL